MIVSLKSNSFQIKKEDLFYFNYVKVWLIFRRKRRGKNVLVPYKNGGVTFRTLYKLEPHIVIHKQHSEI